MCVSPVALVQFLWRNTYMYIYIYTDIYIQICIYMHIKRRFINKRLYIIKVYGG